MKRWGLRYWADPRSGALLAALIAGTVLPASAWAACSSGHDVASGARVAGDASDLELLSEAGAFSHSGADREVPARRPVPCSGAFCSGNPAPAAPSIDSRLGLSGDPWALSVSIATPVAPGSSPCPFVDAIQRPDEPARSIFHPPPILRARVIA